MMADLRRALIVALALALGACEESPSDPTAGAAPLRTVVAVRAQPAPIGEGLVANGLIAPIRTVSVNSDTQGVLVREVDSDAGKVVSAGQVLVRLDGVALQSQIAQASATLRQEQVALSQAQDEAARAARLKGKQVISAEAIAARQFKAASAHEGLAAQQQALAALRTRAARLVLRAPVAGTVIERNVSVGDLTGQSQRPMLVIVPDGQMALKVNVPESAIGQIVPGAPAQITLADGRQYAGRVDHLGAQVVAQSGQAEVWLSFGNALGPSHAILNPGLSGSATIGNVARPVLSIPEKAVLYDGDKASVMAIGHDSCLHRTTVRLGRRGNGRVEIVSGLAEGILVALDSAFSADGDEVHVTFAPQGGL
jgi:HlyD family secretion protein